VITTQSYPYLLPADEECQMTLPATVTAAPSQTTMTLDSVRERVKSRIRTDDAFGYALFSEAIEVLLANDMPTAKNVLFDYIDATIGFEELSLQSGMATESLLDMFSPAGDPRAGDLFRVLAILQQHQGIQFEVSTAA
jgi:hypothetical protein